MDGREEKRGKREKQKRERKKAKSKERGAREETAERENGRWRDGKGKNQPSTVGVENSSSRSASRKSVAKCDNSSKKYRRGTAAMSKYNVHTSSIVLGLALPVVLSVKKSCDTANRRNDIMKGNK